jgi:gamma-carbonic anhydrase
MEEKRMGSSKIREQLRNNSLYPYKKLFPKVHESVFIAPGAKIIGDVNIGEYSTVWYNTVIRGDVHYINVGRLTNIQDCSMLHVTNGLYPLNIGDYVTVGHSVKLHGCTIKNLCLIGIGSVVLDGAIIEEKSIIAAGAVVTPNCVVPSGKLAAGVPAKIIRDLKTEELDEFEMMAVRYKEYGEESLNSLGEFII